MLTDAELLLGLSRHLSNFTVSAATDELSNVAFAGKLYDMAWRLRGSGTSSLNRVVAIGNEAGIARRELLNQVVPAMESLGWLNAQYSSGNPAPISVIETIPPDSVLLAQAQRVLDMTLPSPAERAALEVLRATSRQPLELSTAIDESSAFGEEAAEIAVSALDAIHLVRKVTDDDNRTVVFNPNIWVGDDEVSRAALRAEDAKVSREVGALIEEVAKNPGLPQSSVKSTEPQWIEFAVAHGLVQRSVVQTTGGEERKFLFVPHLLRDAFGGQPRDPSGHARQLVGSMIYAATYANVKLYNPKRFLEVLVDNGEAGDASPIGTDYPMLETAGIVQVVPGSRSYKYSLQLLQADVAEEAIDVLGGRSGGNAAGDSLAGEVRGQRSYRHVERERARLTTDASEGDSHRRRLLSALRDSSAGRNFGGR